MKAGARVDTDKYDKEDARDFVLWKATKPGEPTWDCGIGPGPPGLAHRVLGDGAAPARRAADRHPRRRHRPDLPAPRERDRAERRRDRQAVLALLGARRAPARRRREDVEVARQRLHAAGRRRARASGRRRCATCCSRRTTASSCNFTWASLAAGRGGAAAADRLPRRGSTRVDRPADRTPTIAARVERRRAPRSRDAHRATT